MYLRVILQKDTKIVHPYGGIASKFTASSHYFLAIPGPEVAEEAAKHPRAFLPPMTALLFLSPTSATPSSAIQSPPPSVAGPLEMGLPSGQGQMTLKALWYKIIITKKSKPPLLNQ